MKKLYEKKENIHCILEIFVEYCLPKSDWTASFTPAPVKPGVVEFPKYVDQYPVWPHLTSPANRTVIWWSRQNKVKNIKYIICFYVMNQVISVLLSKSCWHWLHYYVVDQSSIAKYLKLAFCLQCIKLLLVVKSPS